MSTAADSGRFAVSQVRELLAVDRCGAGEARRQATQTSLRTAVFSQPLRVRVKRRWRLDRALRRRVFWGGALMLAVALAAWLLVWDLHKPVKAAVPTLRPFAEVPSAPATVPSVALARDVARSPQLAGPVARTPSDVLPARVRLQRGDLWLRIEGPRAAHAARALLESGLDELPRHARGQAALAQACLRLGDEICARRAIQHAIQARPRREKFRELSRAIERHFR